MTEEKKNYGKTNKRKGSNAERFYAKIFREIGYEFCKTSREASKLHDNAGIDLMFLPFNVQVKAGKQVALNASKELLYMKNRIAELFPPTAAEQFLPKVLIHKKEVGRGHIRTEFDELVFMSFEDYKKLIKA